MAPEAAIEEFEISTKNEHAVHAGTNMSTSTHAMRGRAKWVAVGSNKPVVMRTKQEAYRLAAWLIVLAESEDLPDEAGAHDFDNVLTAIEESRT